MSINGDTATRNVDAAHNVALACNNVSDLPADYRLVFELLQHYCLFVFCFFLSDLLRRCYSR